MRQRRLGYPPVGFVSRGRTAPGWRRGAILSSSLLVSCPAAAFGEGEGSWGASTGCAQRWWCSPSPSRRCARELGTKMAKQGKGKMHDSAFTWGGASHALFCQKRFVTRLQAAGSVPVEQPGFGVSAHPANPASLGSQAAAGASGPSPPQSKTHQRATRPPA